MYLKGLFQGTATFILLLWQIFVDLHQFMLVLVVFVGMFMQAVYIIRPDADFVDISSESVLLLFGFDGPSDDYQSPRLFVLLAIFLLIVVLVLMNVLIAIVSDSYDAAMSNSKELFARARLGQVNDTLSTFPRIFFRQFHYDIKEASTDSKRQCFCKRRSNTHSRFERSLNFIDRCITPQLKLSQDDTPDEWGGRVIDTAPEWHYPFVNDSVELFCSFVDSNMLRIFIFQFCVVICCLI